MSTKYKAEELHMSYFITLTVVNWVEVFSRPNQKVMLVEALKYCQRNKGLEIYAYCIMTNHIHLMCRAIGDIVLADLIRDFKKFTSKQVIKLIKEEPESRRIRLLEQFSRACKHLQRNQKFKVWMDGYHAVPVWSKKFIKQKLLYVHDNPVQAGIVVQPHEYLYSSARNYADMEGVLEIVVLDVF